MSLIWHCYGLVTLVILWNQSWSGGFSYEQNWSATENLQKGEKKLLHFVTGSSTKSVAGFYLNKGREIHITCLYTALWANMGMPYTS